MLKNKCLYCSWVIKVLPFVLAKAVYSHMVILKASWQQTVITLTRSLSSSPTRSFQDDKRKEPERSIISNLLNLPFQLKVLAQVHAAHLLIGG